VLALLAVEKTEPVLLLVNYLLESVFFQQLVRTQHLRVKFLAFEQQKQGLALLVEHVVEVVNAGNLLQVLLHREQHFLELVGLEDPELKDEHVLVARVQNRKVVKLCDYIRYLFFQSLVLFTVHDQLQTHVSRVLRQLLSHEYFGRRH